MVAVVVEMIMTVEGAKECILSGTSQQGTFRNDASDFTDVGINRSRGDEPPCKRCCRRDIRNAVDVPIVSLVR